MPDRVVPVLIVGAGPVGLQLALDLGWRGIECLVVDQAPGTPVVHPRAAGIAVRTMEFFRRWGIGEKVLHGGFPLDFPMDIVYCTDLNGHLIERQQYPTLALSDVYAVIAYQTAYLKTHYPGEYISYALPSRGVRSTSQAGGRTSSIADLGLRIGIASKIRIPQW